MLCSSESTHIQMQGQFWEFNPWIVCLWNSNPGSLIASPPACWCYL